MFEPRSQTIIETTLSQCWCGNANSIELMLQSDVGLKSLLHSQLML